MQLLRDESVVVWMNTPPHFSYFVDSGASNFNAKSFPVFVIHIQKGKGLVELRKISEGFGFLGFCSHGECLFVSPLRREPWPGELGLILPWVRREEPVAGGHLRQGHARLQRVPGTHARWVWSAVLQQDLHEEHGKDRSAFPRGNRKSRKGVIGLHAVAVWRRSLTLRAYHSSTQCSRGRLMNVWRCSDKPNNSGVAST